MYGICVIAVMVIGDYRVVIADYSFQIADLID